MDKIEFSSFIKDSREDLGVTKTRFAELLDINWITVWRWENKHNIPAENIIDMWINKIEMIKNENTKAHKNIR